MSISNSLDIRIGLTILPLFDFSKDRDYHQQVFDQEDIKFNEHKDSKEPAYKNIPSNVDFVCYQNVENRVKALYLVVKYMFGSDKGYKYLVIDRGGWKTIEIFPNDFLWESKPNKLTCN